MIRHVVLISWVPEVTAEQVRRVETELNALQPLISGLRDYKMGSDAGLVEGNLDFAIVADFDDEESYLGYRTHPAHRKIIDEVINPITGQRVAVQYRILASALVPEVLTSPREPGIRVLAQDMP
jgi:Stress responsive A/B Barrel Domain